MKYISELTAIPRFIDVMNGNVILYYVGLGWVLAFVGLFAWAIVSLLHKSWIVMWPLRVLALMGAISATHLYIPLFQLLMSGFTCHMPEVCTSAFSSPN
jgi:uncharacterized membrane protein